MKLKYKISILILTIILIISLLLIAISYFRIDRTAEPVFEGGFIIGGEKYVKIPIGFTEEGKTIAKADSFDIMEIPEDKEHNFLAVRSFLDDWTIVKESYIIPTEGDLNVAYLGRERVAEGIKWDMVHSILNQEFQGEFTIEAEIISQYENEFTTNIWNAVEPIKIGYEDCPVGTDWIGSFGMINGFLVFIEAEDLKENNLEYTCYILKHEYRDLYENGAQHTFKGIG
jgi:hypothetical protein